MSFEISKVYTENPYVDEMVYYTRLMSMDTVLKMQQQADNAETAESLRNGNLFISCVEGTAIFEIFPYVTRDALTAAGIILPSYVAACLKDKNNVKPSDRPAVTKAMMADYIEKYDELNPYYRMLHGLPAKDYPGDLVTNWLPPDGVSIDLTKYVHEMSNAEISILNRYGVLESMIEEDPVNRQYMRYTGKKKIDYYSARRANRFDILYLPTIDSDAIAKMYRDKLDANKFYVLRTIYSEAFKFDSDYYDNFIAILIVLITVVDIISRVQEFITRKEIFDIRSVQYIFKSYGVPFFAEIPLKYQIAMVKNLHTLIKYKSTSKCMVDICSLFGFKNIKIFKYYLLRDRKINIATNDYISEFDEDGNEDLDAEYELKFLKLPLDEDLDNYVRSGANYIDYDEITTQDPKWDGGLDHDMVMKEILKEEFNFSRTKYMSIDTIYDIAKMSAQQSYFFNFLYDNVDLENLLTIEVPFIEPGRAFKVADIFTLLTALTYYYRGVKDMIMDTQSKVLYVNGFNFKADLAKLATEIGPKKINDTVVDPGSTLHAQEQLKKFKIPETSIPSFNEMMDIYINNLEVRDELIKGMQEADNIQVYAVYHKLYEALMTVELTMDFFKNPETGDFYRDEHGDATYTEFLKHRDSAIYYALIQSLDYEDENSRNQYIANLIDSITYALEEYIDSDEFSSLFAHLPVVSSEAVKQYIATVINFYKSYKVDFLGLNTIYILDDKNDGYIRLIDGLELHRFLQKNEFIRLYEKMGKITSNISMDDKAKLIERIYLDIRTWINLKKDDKIVLTDEVFEKLVRLVLYSVVEMTEEISGNAVKTTFMETIKAYDFLQELVNFSSREDIKLTDKLWIYDEDYLNSLDPYMDKVSPEDAGKVITASKYGNSVASVYISDDVSEENSLDMVTEKSVDDYVKSATVSKSNITTSVDEENASNDEIPSERAFLESLTFKTLDEEP